MYRYMLVCPPDIASILVFQAHIEVNLYHWVLVKKCRLNK